MLPRRSVLRGTQYHYKVPPSTGSPPPAPPIGGAAPPWPALPSRPRTKGASGSILAHRFLDANEGGLNGKLLLAIVLVAVLLIVGFVVFGLSWSADSEPSGLPLGHARGASPGRAAAGGRRPGERRLVRLLMTLVLAWSLATASRRWAPVLVWPALTASMGCWLAFVLLDRQAPKTAAVLLAGGSALAALWCQGSGQAGPTVFLFGSLLLLHRPRYLIMTAIVSVTAADLALAARQHDVVAAAALRRSSSGARSSSVRSCSRCTAATTAAPNRTWSQSSWPWTNAPTHRQGNSTMSWPTRWARSASSWRWPGPCSPSAATSMERCGRIRGSRALARGGRGSWARVGRRGAPRGRPAAARRASACSSPTSAPTTTSPPIYLRTTGTRRAINPAAEVCLLRTSPRGPHQRRQARTASKPVTVELGCGEGAVSVWWCATPAQVAAPISGQARTAGDVRTPGAGRRNPARPGPRRQQVGGQAEGAG